MMPVRPTLLAVTCVWALTALPGSGSPVALFALAESLYAAGDWDGSVTEYKRCLFQEPSRVEAAAVFERIADAYRNQEAWDRALSYYARARAAAATDSAAQEARLSAAVTMEMRGDRLSAEVEYARLSAFTPHDRVRERAGVLLALSQLRGRRWDEADRSLALAPPWTDRQREARLDSLLQAGGAIRRPSPGRAKTLSTFVPGLGQAYSGSALGALHAFVLNGVFATLFGRAVWHEHYAEAGFILLPFLHRYYMGNRETAERSASEEYRKATEPVVEEIRALIRTEYGDRR